MLSKIWLSAPHMSGHEKTFIDEAFTSNWIAPIGENINGFEKDLEKYLSAGVNVIALNSGTASIHLALKLLNVEKDDIVLCQSFTFIASANPITYVGAIPVFIDSETTTWNLDPDLLEEAIQYYIQLGKKPKAIVAVHLYGMPYQIDKIHEIASKYNIPIIEDAAEALGSLFKDQHCSTFGDIGILSFNGNKIITTSSGGALVSKSESHCKKVLFFATQAKENKPYYEHSEIGYNYRISNILAGIGRGQMKILKEHIVARRSNYDFYFNALKRYSEITFLKEPNHVFSNRWLTCILTPNYEFREKIRLSLEANNIESRPLWKPLHLQPVFSENRSFENGVSENLFQRGLCLPSGSNLQKEDLKRVVEVIKSFF
ncbi:DegT/DnrJ/EryC1/StrS family aminotransferase [Urechidicola sp. KH5]